jgi:hypothetical protein
VFNLLHTLCEISNERNTGKLETNYLSTLSTLGAGIQEFQLEILQNHKTAYESTFITKKEKKFLK